MRQGNPASSPPHSSSCPTRLHPTMHLIAGKPHNRPLDFRCSPWHACPRQIMNLINGKVALDRIQKFIEAEEVGW